MSIRQPQQDDMQWLACPVCHGALRLAEATVDCGRCGRRYPVVDSLPVLLAARATRHEVDVATSSTGDGHGA